MSKIGEYIVGFEAMDAAERTVAGAIAEQRAMGIEPVCTPAPQPTGWKITLRPDGTVTANTPEAVEWAKTWSSGEVTLVLVDISTE